MLDPLAPLPPDTPLCTTVHAKVAPDTLLVSAMPVVAPEQRIWVVGVAVTVGVGFTVMVPVMGVAGHPLAEGVMVEVAVPGVVPVALSAGAMLEPPAPLPPDTPLCTTVHAKVSPGTLLVSA